jgi:hypothetical protein
MLPNELVESGARMTVGSQRWKKFDDGDVKTLGWREEIWREKMWREKNVGGWVQFV